MNWIQVKNIEQLAEISEKSVHNTIAIFKHSTRCGISGMVLKNIQKEIENFKEPYSEVYLLDLISYREISNMISKKWGIEHQSPQLILIKKNKVIHHSSHYSIDPKLLIL